MTQSVDIYWRGAKVGTGTATAGSATIASTSETSGIGGVHAAFDVGTTANNKHMKDEPVQIHSTTGSNATGKTYQSKVLTHGTTSLVLYDAHPFAD
jgi:hypothetical protein